MICIHAASDQVAAAGEGPGLPALSALADPYLFHAGFKPTAVVAAEAVKHLRVRSLACPAALFLFVANGAFRGARDTK